MQKLKKSISLKYGLLNQIYDFESDLAYQVKDYKKSQKLCFYILRKHCLLHVGTPYN